MPRVLGTGLGDSHTSRVSQSSFQLWKVGSLIPTLEMSNSGKVELPAAGHTAPKRQTFLA